MNHEAKAQLDAIDELAKNANRYRDTPAKIALHTGKLRALLGISVGAPVVVDEEPAVELLAPTVDEEQFPDPF